MAAALAEVARLRRVVCDVAVSTWELVVALDAIEDRVKAAATREEADRLQALSLAMSPACPPLVGDHVPTEWLSEPPPGRFEPKTEEQDQ